jgi:hypothetical protein
MGVSSSSDISIPLVYQRESGKVIMYMSAVQVLQMPVNNCSIY